jgi:hypothetical protein
MTETLEPITIAHEPAAVGLTKEELVLGYVTWQLIGDWSKWVRRRVETISYETANSVRRRVSVDLRLLDAIFREPIMRWGDELVHYVPIAQLRKQSLVNFDLRDEEDRALPLITKNRNSKIASAMLVAAAQSVVAKEINGLQGAITITDPSIIEIPTWLEYNFHQIAYLNPQRTGREPGALEIFKNKFLSPAEPLPIEVWTWNRSTDESLSTPVDAGAWYSLLGSDLGFVRLAYDVARLFLICVPLTYEKGRRRIVKFSYTEYLGQPEARSAQAIKRAAVTLGFAERWNRFEDWLEGVPRSSQSQLDVWIPSLLASQPPRLPLRRQVFQALGWTTSIMRFEAPAAGHGSSYHLNISTPVGIQIRRAQLAPADRARPAYPAQRGSRNLRTVDLHIASKKQNESVNAYINIRPESSLIIRGGFLSSALTAAALTLLWLFADRIERNGAPHADAIAAALVVLPGLLTVLAARDSEHPLATSMVFGLRVLAMSPGVLAVLAAGQVVAGRPSSWFGVLLYALAWAITGLLLVAWRLATRGPPEPDVVPN